MRQLLLRVGEVVDAFFNAQVVENDVPGVDVDICRSVFRVEMEMTRHADVLDLAVRSTSPPEALLNGSQPRDRHDDGDIVVWIQLIAIQVSAAVIRHSRHAREPWPARTAPGKTSCTTAAAGKARHSRHTRHSWSRRSAASARRRSARSSRTTEISEHPTPTRRRPTRTSRN